MEEFLFVCGSRSRGILLGRHGKKAASTGSWEFTSQLHLTGRESKLWNKAMNMDSNQWCSSSNRTVNTFWNSSMNWGPSTQIPEPMGEFLIQTVIDPHTNKELILRKLYLYKQVANRSMYANPPQNLIITTSAVVFHPCYSSTN